VLAGEDANRILGDDPRSLTRRKVFSVAPVPLEGSPQGYLYVVLESEEYAGITQMLQGSYIFRVSVPAIAAGTVSALVVGLLAFWLLTHRVSRLALAMERFKESGFEAPPPPRPASSPGDEIDALERAFADMAQHLVDQMGRLKEGDALRRELVANVSHDLRTPLASLQGYVETLLIKDDSLTPEQRREYLQVASRQSVHLGRLVAELFDLAGLNARETVPHREPFSLSELLQDLVQKFRLRPEAQQVRIETTSGPGIPFVSGDIALIERVLENLLDNALRYTPAGGTVRLSLETVENSVRVRVSDTGRGIPADALPKIFDRYFQADPSDRTGSDRGGLGLAIARRILELHGSVIVAESVPEQGTTFSFQLPVATPVR
jgi:signal transduction histidine kinase